MHEPQDLIVEISSIIGCAPAEIEDLTVLKRSVDSRSHKSIMFVYSAMFRCARKLQAPSVEISGKFFELPGEASGTQVMDGRPIVVGSGPSGMFAALLLARLGFCPVVIEMGQDVTVRHKAVSGFLNDRDFTPEGSLLFGEGGAGTYSDGKLTGRSAGERGRFILESFVQYGASDAILIDAHPHVGTDKLRGVLPRMRSELTQLGATFHFDCRVEKMDRTDLGYVLSTSKGEFKTPVVIFACGQNYDDSYRTLLMLGCPFELKPFQMGVRLEVPQQVVEEWAYGPSAFDPLLPRAMFGLTYRDNSTGLGAHTFCNCPGGEVVPTPAMQDTLCINGMSNSKRDGKFANAAIVGTFNCFDFGCDNAHDALDWRVRIERMVYERGGGGYVAPANTVNAFLKGEVAEELPESSYRLGLHPALFDELLPGYFLNVLKSALHSFRGKIRGFQSPSSLLIGVETRVSSPVRVVRDEAGFVSGFDNLYVVGEGAGYAGGIMSSAIDGLDAALRIASQFLPAGK